MPGFDLRELGWNDELAENLEPGLVPGRVAAVHRGAFDVWTEAGAVRTRSKATVICWKIFLMSARRMRL